MRARLGARVRQQRSERTHSERGVRYRGLPHMVMAERGRETSADIALWSALDRGDDPTTRTES